MKKVIVTAILTAAICFGMVAVQSQARSQPKFVGNIKTGNTFRIASLDLFCDVFAHDPDGHEAGAFLFCDRSSVSGDSRAMIASPYHFEISNPTGDHVAYRVVRTP